MAISVSSSDQPCAPSADPLVTQVHGAARKARCSTGRGRRSAPSGKYGLPPPIKADLAEVYATLERWRRIAALTRADPEAHRRMLQLAARRLAGEETPMVAADEVRARIAQRLGR
jgi:hypothetical protein